VEFPTRSVSIDGDILAVCEDRGAECHVSLAGRITIDSSPDLLELLRQRLESPNCKTVTVDLYDVTYVDTSGLAILVEVLKAAKIQGKTLQLSELRGRPRYLLETSRLLHLFHEVDAGNLP
jgi:anti-sigma B factor antagonist